MVRAEIQQEGHLGTESPDRLQLEGTHLRHEQSGRLAQKKFGHRRPDVPASLGVDAGTTKDPGREFGRGRLPVGPGDRDHRRGGQRVREFQLTDQRCPLRSCLHDEFGFFLDPGTQHNEVMISGNLRGVRTGGDRDSLTPEIKGLLLKRGRRTRVQC